MQALPLPPICGIPCASDLGEEAFLVRASRAFDAGLTLVQMRERDWPVERVAAFAARLRDLAHAYGAKVLLNGEADAARGLGLDGVHWTSARLAAATSRPRDLVVGASCHDAVEIARAGVLGCDFAVLGPVRATPSHPGVRTLGWNGFARAIEGTRLPVYALGGLAPADLDAAVDHGAHGIAMRRGAWEK